MSNALPVKFAGIVFSIFGDVYSFVREEQKLVDSLQLRLKPDELVEELLRALRLEGHQFLEHLLFVLEQVLLQMVPTRLLRQLVDFLLHQQEPVD